MKTASVPDPTLALLILSVSMATLEFSTFLVSVATELFATWTQIIRSLFKFTSGNFKYYFNNGLDAKIVSMWFIWLTILIVQNEIIPRYRFPCNSEIPVISLFPYNKHTKPTRIFPRNALELNAQWACICVPYLVSNTPCAGTLYFLGFRSDAGSFNLFRFHGNACVLYLQSILKITISLQLVTYVMCWVIVSKSDKTEFKEEATISKQIKVNGLYGESVW